MSHDSLSRLDELIEYLPFGALFEDDTGHVVYANRAFSALLGVRAEELRNLDRAAWVKRISALLVVAEAMETLSEWLMGARRALEGQTVPLADGRTLAFDYFPIYHDEIFLGGVWRFRHGEPTPVKQPGGSSELARDAYLRTIIDNVPMTLFFLDTHGVVTWIDGRPTPNFPLRAEDVIGLSVFDILQWSSFDFIEDALRRALAGEDISSTIDLGAMAFDVRMTPARDEQGTITGIMGIAHDVTERKRSEAALRQQNVYLEALHETTLSLVDRLEVDDLLASIVERAARLLGSEHGYIYLNDPSDNLITLRYASGIFTKFVGFRMAHGEGLAGKVLESGEPLFTEHYDAWAGRSMNFPEETIGSLLVVPLRYGPDVTGVIGVAHLESGYRFQPTEVKLLGQFAELASIALDNAQLYTSAQQEIGERARTEAALRLSEERYRSVIGAMAEGVILFDAEGQVTASNETARRILRLSDLQLLGQLEKNSSYQLIRENGSVLEIKDLPQFITLQTGQAFMNTILGVRLDGEVFAWLSVNSQPMFREGAAMPHAAVVSFSDITESVRAAQALRKSERRNNALLEALPDMMFAVTRDGTITEYKVEDEALLAVPADQLIGIQVRDLPLGPTFRGNVLGALERAMVTDSVQRFEFSTATPNAMYSGTHYYEARMTALNDDEALCIIRDISERIHVEQELNKRIDLLAALQQVDDELTRNLDIDHVLTVSLHATLGLSGAEHGFIGLIEDNFVTMAQATEVYKQPIYGQDPLQLNGGILGRVTRSRKGELITDVIGDPDYMAVIPSTRAKIVMPLVTHDQLVGVLNLETNDATRFTEEIFQFLELLTARVATAIDNARLYQASQTHLTELQTVYNQVSELEQLKTQMIRVASHDLRSPLGVLSGYLALLRDDLGPLAEQFASYLDPMERAIGRMQQMTTDVLSLERIHASETHTWKIFSLRDTVERALEDNREQHGLKPLVYNSEMTADSVPMVGDPVQIYEAVTNLIGNAIKYTPPGGHVTVLLRLEGEAAILEVKDTGLGVPGEYQAQLFQPFFRVKTDETKLIDGTGLGLYLVKSIVERHGGSMRFESVHGEGSTFGFTIPLVH